MYTEEVYRFLEQEFHRLMDGWDVEILEMNYEMDHIHLLISTTPFINLGTMINSLKSVTSRTVRKTFPEHLKRFYWKPYFWSRSYLILSSGGASIEVLKKYIQNQKGEDTSTTKQ